MTNANKGRIVAFVGLIGGWLTPFIPLWTCLPLGMVVGLFVAWMFRGEK